MLSRFTGAPVPPQLPRFERIAAERRQVVLDDLKPYHNPDNIAVDKPEHFIRALGWPVSNYLIVEPTADTEPRLRSIASKDEIECSGVYLSRLGLALVLNICDPTRTEETLVHELAHGSVGVENKLSLRAIQELIQDKRVRRKTRSFVGPAGGRYIEEGFVSLVTATYREAVKDVRGEVTDFAHEFSLPAKYNEQDHYTYGSLALATLCMYEPKLTGQLFETRTNGEVREDVAKTINGIEPGLHENLYRIQREEDRYANMRNFYSGLRTVLRVGGYTVDSIPAICEHSPVQAFVDEKLAAYEQATGYSFQPPTNVS